MPKCVFERLSVGRFVIGHKALGIVAEFGPHYVDDAGIIIKADEYIDNSYSAWPRYLVQTPSNEIHEYRLDVDCITPATYKEVLGAHLMIKNGIWHHDHNHGFDAPVMPEGVVMKPNIKELFDFTVNPCREITIHHSVGPEDV